MPNQDLSRRDPVVAYRARNGILWLATLVVVFGMGSAGIEQFARAERLIGLLEVGGASLILFPGLATYVALVACVSMLGAAWSNPGNLGLSAHTAALVLLWLIAFARRHDRWTPTG